MRSKDQTLLRILVRARMDFQAMRKAMDNRLGRKADGKAQNLIEDRAFRAEDIAYFDEISKAANAQEQFVEKALAKTLKRFAVYNDWLVTVKGVGTIGAAWLLAEFDIHQADTVSKLWQYAGLNPGMVRGKKRIKIADHKDGNGEIIKTLTGKDGSKDAYLVLTDEMVRGDRATEGFVLPFNRPLRTAIVGVLADGFIKQQNSYALEFYYPYKERLAQEENEVLHVGKMVPWKDVNKAHRDRAAKRKMMKEFIKDFYVAWRTCEGLLVRVPYAEEYLGRQHGTMEGYGAQDAQVA